MEIIRQRLTPTESRLLRRFYVKWSLTEQEVARLSRYLRSRRQCMDFDRMTGTERAVIDEYDRALPGIILEGLVSAGTLEDHMEYSLEDLRRAHPELDDTGARRLVREMAAFAAGA